MLIFIKVTVLVEEIKKNDKVIKINKNKFFFIDKSPIYLIFVSSNKMNFYKSPK